MTDILVWGRHKGKGAERALEGLTGSLNVNGEFDCALVFISEAGGSWKSHFLV